ncbi:hypothetical protein Bca52824_048370 [Brassica carinata]|uniref:Uncharacterized protein n=1 Tax=Brassica carinata TaxID=52824 RepID=A0A8X7UT58_BRACI|nr:hypothetical protein Bca52824_048370 [Brassica carinata]
MATRSAFRFVSRRFSNGKVLNEEAAENVFIKKMEKERLEKIARQGPGEQAASGAKASGGGGGGTSSAGSAESGPKVSEDKDRNYAVVAGVVAVVGAIGWYMKSGPKVSEDKDRNYAVVAGVVAVVGAIGWYMKSGGKKQKPEVQE